MAASTPTHAAPHLGTDNLVRLLKNFRAELLDLGATIKWDCRVASFTLDKTPGAATHTAAGAVAASALATDEHAPPQNTRRVRGVVLANGEALPADGVVLAAGHSARELYQELIACGATLTPKDFAVGFRVEHPQVCL